MLLHDLNYFIFHILQRSKRVLQGHFVDTNLFFVLPLSVVCAFSKLQYTRNMNLVLFKTIQFLQNSNIALDSNSMWERKVRKWISTILEVITFLYKPRENVDC